MKQTAVEWLHNQLHLNISLYQDEWQIIEGLMDQAKEMEKEQIMDAHEEGFYSPPFRMSRRREAEQYYNETYESKTNI
jgi:HEPN domain-containing protein